VSQERRITKVKYDTNKVVIKYQTVRPDGEPDEYEVKCGDLPHADFMGALKALVPHAGQITELILDNSEVRGVSFSYTNDVMGACITVLKKLETTPGPLIINTPHLPSEPYNPDQDPTKALLLSDKCVEALEKLQREALAYLDGKRAQGSLFSSLFSSLTSSLTTDESVQITAGDRTVTLRGKKAA